MKKYDILNKLISADDLYWNEHEKKYVAISEEQIKEIILVCGKQNIYDFEDILKIINWVTLLNFSNLLLKNFLANNLRVVGFDEENSPCFGATNE